MRRKDGRMVAVIALCIAIIGLSVGFAALSTTLTINGTAKVATSTFKVITQRISADSNYTTVRGRNLHYNVSPATATSIAQPTFTDSNLSGFDGVVKTPGDELYFSFNIVNTGNYKARLVSMTPGTYSLIGSGATAAADVEKVRNKLDISLTQVSGTGPNYVSGEAIPTGWIIDGGCTSGNMAPCTKTVILSVKYDKDLEMNSGSDLPEGDVSIEGISYSLVFEQTA